MFINIKNLKVLLNGMLVIYNCRYLGYCFRFNVMFEVQYKINIKFNNGI